MITSLITNLSPGDYDFMEIDTSQPATGFDSINAKVLYFDPAVTQSVHATEAFPLGTAWADIKADEDLAAADLFIQDRKAKSAGAPGLWEIDLLFQGRIGDKAGKLSLEADGQEITTENVMLGGDLVARLSTLENNLVLRHTYFGTGTPDTTRLGTAVADLDALLPLTLPDEFWDFLTHPLVHYPHGWTLTSMPTEFLVGVETLFWQVTDVWTYRKQYTP